MNDISYSKDEDAVDQENFLLVIQRMNIVVISTFFLSSLKKMKARLELLPDELLLYIFFMIPTFDLLKNISHLNSRFDAVLRSIPLTWDLGWPLLDEFFNHLHQIVYLNCTSSFVFMPDFSPRILPQLRSLTLNEASATQIRGIRPHYLPHLVHLSVTPLYTETEEEMQLLETLFIKKERFVQLKTCRLESLRDILPRLSIQISSPLRALTLHRCHTIDLIKLLELFPLLTYPKLTLLITTLDIPFHDESHIVRHNNLRSFVIHLANDGILYLEELDSLLIMMPFLRHLSVSMLVNETFAFGILLHILENRVPKLKQFNCSILMAKSITVMPDITIVQELSPLFRRIQLDWYRLDQMRYFTFS